MKGTQCKQHIETTELGQTGLRDHPRRLRRLGDRRRGLGVRLGAPGRRRSRSRRSTARSSSASTGSTRPPPTASATPRRSSAARSQGLATERPYVFTKASLLEGADRRVVHSLKRDSILREAHASLERLGVDAIDLYQIHWPTPSRHRGGLGRVRRAQGAGTRPPHRRLELRRRAATADPADRAGRDPPAASTR